MKTNRILSTAGMCQKNATRLRSYCNLMQGSLNEKWLFADDFIESHVCFVTDKYLANLDKQRLDKSQVIVVINKYENSNLDDKYQITLPLTATKIKNVLNQISNQVEFKPLSLTSSKKKINKFKSAFAKIRSNFFGKKGRDMIEIKQKSKDQFISRITQKIQLNEFPPYKIVLLGSPGSGKTTAIQAVSDGKALNSDVSATDSVASDKSKTTVGIDYAEIKFSGNNSNKHRKIKLFGTPGQIKFNFVWDMVGKNANAFIILLDMSRPEPLSYLKFYKKFIRDEIGRNSQVFCALTHSDKYQGDTTSFMDCIASEFPQLSGVYKIDSRRQEDVLTILKDIYPQIDKKSKELDNKATIRSPTKLSLLNG